MQSTKDDLAAHKEQLEAMSSLKTELMEKIANLSSEKDEQDISNQMKMTEGNTQVISIKDER